MTGPTLVQWVVLVLVIAFHTSSALPDEESPFSDVLYLPSTAASSDPADGNCDGLVVWAHGLGDTSKGWEGTMREVRRQLPHLCFALPTAPTRRVTYGSGFDTTAWYDFDGTETRNATVEGDAAGIGTSARALQLLGESAADRLGVPRAKTVYGGFSQGAVVSLHVGLTAQSAALVVVGGYLGAPSRFAGGLLRARRKANKAVQGGHSAPVPRLVAAAAARSDGDANPTPSVLLLHGDDDDIVPLVAAEYARDRLAELGVAPVSLETFVGVRHGMDKAMMGRLIEYLRNVLPPRGSRGLRHEPKSEL